VARFPERIANCQVLFSSLLEKLLSERIVTALLLKIGLRQIFIHQGWSSEQYNDDNNDNQVDEHVASTDVNRTLDDVLLGVAAPY
jgi:hypothetical protein